MRGTLAHVLKPQALRVWLPRTGAPPRFRAAAVRVYPEGVRTRNPLREDGAWRSRAGTLWSWAATALWEWPFAVGSSTAGRRGWLWGRFGVGRPSRRSSGWGPDPGGQAPGSRRR